MKRITELLASEAASTAGTKVIDVNVIDLITRIVVQMKGTNSTGVPVAHPAKMISKIELVDGSDVLFSLSGVEAQALNFFEEDDLPVSTLMYVNNVKAIATFHINFGRFRWDPKLALDPARFSNLQLKITHNMAAGGGTPDAGELAVFAELMTKDEATPMGFLMSKEIQSYALTSSAHEYIVLPTDYAYRKLMIKSLAADKQPWEQYNKIKLSIDNDKTVLINNMSTSDLLKFISSQKEVTETIIGTGTGSAETTYITPTMWTTVSILGLNSALSSVLALQSYGGTLSVNTDSAELYQGIVRGRCPHGAMDIPFGIQSEPESWLKMTGIGSLRLDITAGSSVGSSSTAEIVVQQLRTYAGK